MSEYIVVIPRIEGNPERGYGHCYYSDNVRLPNVRQCINHGFGLGQSDDFLIGQLDGNRLLSLQWMDEVRDDQDELTEAASQLGFAS